MKGCHSFQDSFVPTTRVRFQPEHLTCTKQLVFLEPHPYPWRLDLSGIPPARLPIGLLAVSALPKVRDGLCAPPTCILYLSQQGGWPIYALAFSYTHFRGNKKTVLGLVPNLYSKIIFGIVILFFQETGGHCRKLSASRPAPRMSRVIALPNANLWKAYFVCNETVQPLLPSS